MNFLRSSSSSSSSSSRKAANSNPFITPTLERETDPTNSNPPPRPPSRERSADTAAMEAAGGATAAPPYTLQSSKYNSEDIIFCIDIDRESMVEMKNTGPNGKPITRLEAIRQAVLLFINAKLTINPDHRFAFAVLGKTVTWVRKEFSSDIDSASAALRSLSVSPSGGQADLTQLFRIAAHEAKKSRSQNRILRVVLLYCRSSLQPQFQWPTSQKLFTFDVIYLHDKPGPDNCPQKVYDALVEALELVTEHEGYIYESGQGLLRILFRQMCLLLSHPQQRCLQDDLNLPMALTKKSPAADSTQSDDSVTVISQ